MGIEKSMTKDKTADTPMINNRPSFFHIMEQLLEKSRSFNLLNNEFMSVVLNDIPACQHVIQIITGIPDLTVKEVRTQYRISKLRTHDAILDVLAEDSQGRLINLEIQRRDTVDHAKRVRYYTSLVDSEALMKGKEYHELPEIYVLYISETDLWKAGQTVYPVNKSLGSEKFHMTMGSILYT